MRIFSILCLILAAALGCFAYWGLSTAGGQAAFDEMAGLIPFGAGLLGCLLFVIGIIAALLARRRAA